APLSASCAIPTPPTPPPRDQLLFGRPGLGIVEPVVEVRLPLEEPRVVARSELSPQRLEGMESGVAPAPLPQVGRPFRLTAPSGEQAVAALVPHAFPRSGVAP